MSITSSATPDRPPAARDTRPVVLDTNVVLDWLFFADPHCRALGEAIETGALHWFATEAMREELEHVLTRAPFSSRPESVAALRASWLRWARRVEPTVTAPRSAFRCTDPDDQKFIDLALQLGAPTQLVSRDRAVLRIARSATREGVHIVSIAAWAAAPAALSG